MLAPLLPRVFWMLGADCRCLTLQLLAGRVLWQWICSFRLWSYLDPKCTGAYFQGVSLQYASMD